MATVIKGGLARQEGAVFQFLDLPQQRESILEQARATAAEIIAAARAEAGQIRTNAEREGYEAGRGAAQALVRSEAAAAVDSLRPMLQTLSGELTQMRQAWIAQWEQQAVRLATAIAGRVIRRELVHQPDIPVSLVAEALQLVAGKPDIRILLHPEDQRVCGEQIARLATELSGVAGATVVADASIGRGGCRVETRHGTIDQTIEAQLQRIEKELT